MTTPRSTPVRTMLPPNLTRHFYEARRASLGRVGQQLSPWFQLSEVERAVVEGEMDLFRQAIRSAEEEQDLLASLDATKEAPVDEQPAAAADTTGEDVDACACPGCTLNTALSAFLQAAHGLKAALGGLDAGGNSYSAVKYGFATPVTTEQQRTTRTTMEKIARDAIDRWVAEGKPVVETTTDTIVWPYAPNTVRRMEGLGESRFEAQGREYRAQWRVVPLRVTDFPR